MDSKIEKVKSEFVIYTKEEESASISNAVMKAPETETYMIQGFRLLVYHC